MGYLKIVIPIIVVIIIGGIIVFNSNQEIVEEEIQWRSSGPFSIEKYEYNLGEKIFLNVVDIPKDVKGNVIVFRPTTTPNLEKINNLEGVPKEAVEAKVEYVTIEFDGSAKDNFNRYFEPKLYEFKNICSRDDLIGEWAMVFQGTEYEPINFKVLNETSSWDKRTFDPVC